MQEKRHLIAVGIDYTHTASPLSGTVHDACTVRDAVLAGGGTVETLLSRDATAAAICATWTRVIDGATRGDIVIFYFSGHGVLGAGNLEIAPVTLSRIDPIDVPVTAAVPLTPAMLASDLVVLDGACMRTLLICPAIHAGVNLLVILDCCYAGGMCSDDIHLVSPMPQIVSSHVAPSSNIPPEKCGHVVALAAATAYQRAGDGSQTLRFNPTTRMWGQTASHGTFTNALMHVLRKETSTTRTNREIHAAVCDRLLTDGVAQTPMITASSQAVFDHPFEIYNGRI